MVKGRKKVEKRESRSVSVDGIRYDYLLIYTSKRRGSASLSLKKDGSFEVRASFRYKEDELDSFVAKSIPKLLKKKKRKEDNQPIGDGYIYLFGNKIPSDEYDSLDEDGKRKYLTAKLSDYISSRIGYWMERVGNKKPISFKIKGLKSAYGIYHPRKREISFALTLVHYRPRTIDSVIAHELTHDFINNHGRRFYAKLLAAFPDYPECRKELIQRDYEGKNRLKKQP